jgi:RNA polymerase sigma-70 factor (ECF subfamily)
LEVRQAAGDDLPYSPRNPEDQAAGWEIEARVQEALLQLPDSLRLPVVLFEIEGLPYGEIASVLGLAEGTVKSRIHRARQVLRTKLRGTMGRLNDGVSS